MAIKRAIATQQEEGIRETDLQLAFNAEYMENDIFPTTDITEDWLKLIDYDPENVVKIAPVKATSDSRWRTTSGVISQFQTSSNLPTSDLPLGRVFLAE
jgi:proteasome-associated ATPase